MPELRALLVFALPQNPSRIVESCGAYMEKAGHDEVHVLALMTATSGVGERVAALSSKLGLTTEVRDAV